MGASPQRLKLGRAGRIKRTCDFALARKLGQRLAMGCLVGNWRTTNSERSRVGVVTSAKLGNAVVRNRARRLLRESFRMHQHELSPVDLILVARASILGKGLSEVERDFMQMARRAGLLNAKAGPVKLK
jgi:ribonuclease P protein component